MSKRTYICLDCHTAKRAEASYGRNTQYRCSQCRGKLIELPWRRRIPKKSDDAGWRELRQFVSELERDRLPRRRLRGEALLAKLDGQINAFARREQSDERDRLLKYLRWKRKQIQRGYTKE